MTKKRQRQTPVVSKMGFVEHVPVFKNSNTSNKKIPEYAKDFKKEWLYITGINKKCGEVETIISDYIDEGQKAVLKICRIFNTLSKNFKNVLEAQKIGKLKKIRDLKFKLNDVFNIINLKDSIFSAMGNNQYVYFFTDEEVQEFPEDLIIFTHKVNIKDKRDFEDNSYLEYLDYSDSDSDSDIDVSIEDEVFRVAIEIIDNDSDSDDE